MHAALLALLWTSLMGCASNRLYIDERYQDWDAQAPPPDTSTVYQVFLIGDAGAASRAPLQPSLRLLQAHLAEAGAQAAVVFLGDNIYCCGLPDSTAPGRAEAERRLLAQLDAVRGFPGRVVFIPGNHDWNDSQRGGREALARQEAFVEAALDRANVFLPDDGFPGPVEVDLTDALKLIILDTEWWLTDEDKPFGDAGDYRLQEPGDFLLYLDDLIQRRDDEQLLVVGHHPLFSNGSHGGFFPVRTHLFPLTDVWDYAYLPLPLLGSLYPLYVRFLGGRQDLADARYRLLRESLVDIFSQHEALVYASGHDHSLQYFVADEASGAQHYLTSGSGSKVSAVAGGNDAVLADAAAGFMSVRYYRDGSAWLSVWTPEGDGPSGQLVFRSRLHAPSSEISKRSLPDPAAPDLPDYRDSTVTVAAHPGFAAGAVKTFFYGAQHRAAWTTPVEVPVLDLGREAGGLTPIKIGGGLQTTSLRLQGADGKQYVLRSLMKDPTRTLPESLKGTEAAEDILRDQVSIIHPYGALIIPPLADAAGVYHTNPKVVFVPDDPRLGPYRSKLAGQVMLLEERPDDDMSDAASFGRSKEVIGASKLFREIDGDNDHRVDQQAFVRARLFDMLMSDWDRHRDQWRWAAFEPGELDTTLTGEAATQGKVYRPIPRDRDWAFNRMGGLFPSVVKSRYVESKFQDFGYGYGYLPGLNENGLEQDRRFTNALTRSDWLAAADSLRAALTDDVIEAAVRAWPAPIVELDGAEFIDKLKVRRDKLPEVAATYYEMLAGVVDVVGSHKHERFEVTRLGDNATEVVVYSTKRDGAVRDEIYRRTFLHDETHELRLFGLDGNDQFVVTGTAGRGLDVLAIGGPGLDAFSDDAHVSRGGKTRFFDTTGGAAIQAGPETDLEISDAPDVNTYDPFAFSFDDTLPQLFFGSNQDDGLFVGGGVKVIRHGFRKAPYASSQRLVGNFAARTQAFNVVYTGHFVEVVGPFDLGLAARWLSPNNIRNYYGLGNETTGDAGDAEYYQARLQQIDVVPQLLYRPSEGMTLFFGPALHYYDVAADDGRFVDTPQAGVSEASFEDQWYAGFDAGFRLSALDRTLNPRQGLRWTGGVVANFALLEEMDDYATLRSDLRFYHSFSLYPQITLALRVGGAHNLGDFPFFGANTLGGGENLRGYRGTRFAGRTSFYQSAELRARLFGFSTYVANGQAGVLGFLDNGRVWTDGERSRQWHQGYGGGLWGTLFDTVGLTATVAFSREDRAFALGMDFFF